jgi:hypothetical protein
MEKIEELEQLLLQHMRTAGLRNNKENILIEEMLDIRKERRKLFAKILEKNKALEKENASLKEEIRLSNEKQGNFIQCLKDQYALDLNKREKEWNSLENALNKEIELIRENQRLTDDNKIEQIRKSYEVKLAQLETKLADIVKEKQLNDLTKAKLIAEDLLKKITNDLETKYHKKVNE